MANEPIPTEVPVTPVVAQPITPPVVAKPVETKPASQPAQPVAKAPDQAKPAGEDKTKPVSETKPEASKEAKPSEVLKTLLDEASEEEVKVGEDGKPIESKEGKVVPEKYTFSLAEGQVIDDKALEAVTPVFKKLGLSNEEAQELVDLQVQLNKQNEEQHAQAFNQYLESLKEEAKTFFGPKLPEVMRNVARARDQFIHKELQDKLNNSGLANDKDVLVMLDKLGRTVAEGKFVEGKRSAPVKGEPGKTQEQANNAVPLSSVYPSMAKS